MKFIGITGGVGAGKSAILDYLKNKPDTKVMLADEIAHELMVPGTQCYDRLKAEFGTEDIYQKDGFFDRIKLAQVIFSDDEKRKKLNGIVHPAVRKYVIGQAAYERKEGKIKLLVLEAALLIEEHYDEICDELWYIYTSEENRRIRLKKQRNYSDEKISEIFNSQLTDEKFRKACRVVIDNNGTIEAAAAQIEAALMLPHSM
ncbi:MAG: dephospho-CoA kinase [Lachnospiraceae bacterium]|nr:dephospho-CoA kinase [uncultured Agathobacter sp.]MCI7114232.1 dephospho-CoA kinase [Lachnobacterium sp.]MDD6138296.1 dephospho-CoA kinase [Lachnospiraceae bacterium]MDY6157178.1 dephospho-CoA kinase [Agathobacter sp.]MEE1033293.1 dephospho-CoA kinase [Agathobacter sp.]